MGIEDSHPKIEQKSYEQKVVRNWQLLLMYHKLEQTKQSCWSTFFRFERSQIFRNIQSRCTAYRTVRIRLDDVIYMLMLVALCLTFYFLPIPNAQHYLYLSFRYFLVFIILFSALWLLSGHYFKHFFNIMVTLVFPLLTLLLYNHIIAMDPVDTSTATFAFPESLQYFYPIAALLPTFVCLYLVYPLKQFIRNKIGSLYSYLFALSFLGLFIIWPMYSLIYDYIQNSTLTFDFITQNQALIITFIVIITFSFHLLTHNTFFEGDLTQANRLLLYDFTKQQVIRAVQTITEQHVQQSFIYRNYQIYVRIMSSIVLCFTLLIEIYTFIYLSNNLTQIIQGIAVMGFGVLFLVYGCIINRVGAPRSSVLFVSSIISLVPVSFSAIYYTLDFYQYVFLSCVLPYTTIFWCVIRSLSHRKPFLKTNALVLLYIFVHIPVTLFIINSLGMITTDTAVIQIINYVIAAILALVFVTGTVGFIVWLCVGAKQLPETDKKQQKQLDYNYHQPGDPPYVPYKKQQTFSLEWLGSLDIRNMAQLFSCVFFICSQLATFYAFNQLFYTIDLTAVYSAQIIQIIQSQFIIALAFFIYCFAFIVLDVRSVLRVLLLGCWLVIGLTLIILSYTITLDGFTNVDFAFRLTGAVMIVICGLGIPLQIIKRKNPQIDNFISGLLTIILWILLIIPYVTMIPIISIYVPISEFGMFIYYLILATTVLMIIMVSIVSLIFNLLLGKFEQQKKRKFLTEDVNVYLKEQGIQPQDQVMHILYQSYEHRDRKFVFFLKRGFPVRLWKQQSEENQLTIKTIVYNHEDLMRKASLSKISPQDSRDNCWKCLTFCCGVDQDQIENKLQKAHKDQILQEQQIQDLLPKNLLKDFFQKGKFIQNDEPRKKATDPSKIFSSKSIILKHLNKKQKILGQEYAMLQRKIKQRTQKQQSERQNQKLQNKSLQIQIWHQIFDFIANNDDSPLKIIYNDFKKFCELVQIPENKLTTGRIDELFFDHSASEWKNISAINIQQFSLIVENISNEIYFQDESVKPRDRLPTFLLNYVYPKLSCYSQFRDLLNQRKVNSRNRKNLSRQSFEEPSFNNTNSTKYESSPFVNSFSRYADYSKKNKNKNKRFTNQKAKYNLNKLIQPNSDAFDQQARKKREAQANSKQKIKQKSCKLKTYQKYKSITQCCRKQQQDDQGVIKRKNIKPWQYLSVEIVRIMQRKQTQWRDNKQQSNYQFRPILNNFIIALFKLADLYTYMEITILNPEIGWQTLRSFSILIIQYRIQFYIALALIFVCIIFGVKGISYILEDRLGLTQNRLPATFPHPMFLFTTIYKLLILALFNTIIMTLLSTFMCDWSGLAPPYYLILTQQNPQLQCFSIEHDLYLIFALIGIIVYYPLSAYTMPNFQFAQKTLDLKYKPSYLIIYFQVNFILAAGKVLLSQINTPLIPSQTTVSQIQPVEVVFQAINIASLLFLLVSVRLIEPCLIRWFNYIEIMVISIGLIWNVMGLVLYLTALWQLAIIISCCLTAAVLIAIPIFIKKRFFTSGQVMPDAQDQQIQQLQMNWKTRKQYHYGMIKNKKNQSSEKQSDVLFEDSSQNYELKEQLKSKTVKKKTIANRLFDINKLPTNNIVQNKPVQPEDRQVSGVVNRNTDRKVDKKSEFVLDEEDDDPSSISSNSDKPQK